MKKSNKKSAQTDGSGGAKISVQDQAEISRHIDIKKQIGKLEETLGILCQYTKPDLDAVVHYDFEQTRSCAIDMEICHIEQELCKEYAKLGISMPDLSEKEKEKWK